MSPTLARLIKQKTPRAIRRYSVNTDGKSVKGPGEIFR